MRAWFAWVMLRTLPTLEVRGSFRFPVGWAAFGGLGWLTRPGVGGVLRFGFDIALVAYVAGLGPPIALGLLLAVWTLTVTANSSHGAINHGHVLIGVVLAAQFGGWVTHWGAGADAGRWTLATSDQTMVWWTVQAVTAAYAASGIAKVVDSGFGWLRDADDLVLYAAANSRPGPAQARRRRIVGWVGAHRGLARLGFGAGLVAEILAPLSLYNRWSLVAGGVILWTFHRANQEFLGLAFGSYRQILLIYFVNVGYLVARPLGLL